MLTNKGNIPLPIAAWLAYDDYDYSDDPMEISATTLLKSTRQVILGNRSKGQSVNDIMDFFASSNGTAVHDAIERVWRDNAHNALRRLGYEESFIDRIVVNPSSDAQLPDNAIKVYLENRVKKQIGKYTISGKYDIVFAGQVQDYKNTSTYAYNKTDKYEDYIKQGSIYRWLDPETIDNDFMVIYQIYTDWKRSMAEKSPNYPPLPINSIELPLMSIEETETFIRNKLKDLETYWESHETELPLCTDKDLWIGPSKFKYYKDANKTSGRSTKNFNSYIDAHDRMMADAAKGANGIVIEQKGEAKACHYCPAFDNCSQKDKLIGEGLLKI